MLFNSSASRVIKYMAVPLIEVYPSTPLSPQRFLVLQSTHDSITQQPTIAALARHLQSIGEALLDISIRFNGAVFTRLKTDLVMTKHRCLTILMLTHHLLRKINTPLHHVNQSCI